MSNNILDILKELNLDNGKNYKRDVLKKYESNELFKKVCHVTYNPRISFYIRKVPNFLPLHTGKPTMSLERAIDTLLGMVASRNVTGNEAIEYVSTILSSVDIDDAEVLTRIIKRDLNVKVSTNSINEVWPSLIPVFPVLLASPDKPKTRANIRFPAIAQVKADGGRTCAIVSGGTVTYYTRNGNTLDKLNTPELDNLLISIRDNFGTDCMVDGEIVFTDKGGNLLNRKTSNGLFSKANLGTLEDSVAEFSKFFVWDIVNLEHFYEEREDADYITRFSNLVKSVPIDQKRVVVIDSKEVDNWQQIEDYYGEVVAEGHEGLIIKNTDGIWQNDRSKDCVKMKAEEDCDLRIVGYNPHNKNPDWIGSLIMQSAGDNPVIVNVGSGLKESGELDRKQPFSAFEGKIAKVIYNEIIKSKDDKKSRSLFLPRILCLRHDKDEADVL